MKLTISGGVIDYLLQL